MSNIQPVGYALVQGSQVLAGTEPVVGAHGAKDLTVRSVYTPEGTMLAPESGVPYVEAVKLCAWDDYTCKAAPAKGTPLCFGHLQSFIKGNDGMIKGEEALRLIQYKAQFQEIEKKRLEDKAKEKEEHWTKHGPKDEVTDGS